MFNNEDYEDFEALLNDYLPTEENARIKVTGNVSQKDRNYVYLDVPGQRTSVRVRAEELEDCNIGDEIEVLLIGETEDGDFIIGSRKRIQMEEGIKDIEDAAENAKILKAKITKRVKGGYLLEYKGQQGFLPNSLSEIPQAEGESAVGKEIDVIVKEVKAQKGMRGNKITFSKKDITIAEAAKEFENLHVGDIVSCEITKVMDFGLSVKLDHLRGFIHISEVSWKKLDKLSDIYNVGDKIEAKVISLEPEKKNVKLSIKALTTDPWITAAEKYSADTDVDGTVTKIMPYGVFVEIMDGVEGLVHTSDFAWNRKRVNINDYVKIGDKVKVRILEFLPSERKLKLGIKQLSENPWDTADSKYVEGTVVTGKVVEVKPFGIFIEIEPGLDAFIHHSDFTWQGADPIKFEIGDKVEFKIIELNKEANKIKGSIKVLSKSPWEAARESLKVGDVLEKEVKNVMDFGLFINLAKGVDGFIPVQLVSKEFVKDIKEKFKPGDMVKAQIIEIDDEKKRVKLSIKKLEIDEEKRENQELLDKYGTSEDNDTKEDK